MECRCGEYLSNTAVPNDIELRCYMNDEWIGILNLKVIESWLIPSPKYDVWKCSKCGRLYVFESGNNLAVKVYKIIDTFKINKYDLNSKAKDDNRLRVYTDREWDKILYDDIIEMDKFPDTKYDVIKSFDCQQIYVFEKETDNVLIVYKMEE